MKQSNYDSRRLILAPQVGSTGLWYPRFGELNAKEQLNRFGELSFDRIMVTHDDDGLHLPDDLSEKIHKWLKNCNEAREINKTARSEKSVQSKNQRQRWEEGKSIAVELATLFDRRKQIEYQGCVVLPSKLPESHNKKFILGSERKWIERRNHRDFRSVSAHRTYVSYLLREEMTDDLRKMIFPTPFHLGSKTAIASGDFSWAKLASTLKGLVVAGTEAKDQYKQIRQKLPSIIGHDIAEPVKLGTHSNCEVSKAMKVIGLLHQLAQSRKIDGKTPQIMKMLKLPEDGGEFSFSFRSAYPFKGARESSWLIGDLKAHLGAELLEENFRTITRLYEGLNPFIDRLANDIEASIYGRERSIEKIARNYDSVVKEISQYRCQVENTSVNLDEDLYRHIHLLEFSHFVVGYPQLADGAKTICATNSVVDELHSWVQGLGVDVDIYTPFISIDGVKDFAEQHQEIIMQIMDAAIGHNWATRTEPKLKRRQWPGKRTRPAQMSQWDYDRLIDVAQNLLRMLCWMHAAEANRADIYLRQITPLQAVAAVCSVWHTVDDATTYAPKWQGSRTQGGKLSESLEKPVFSEETGMDAMPMEHRHLLSMRTEWFANALIGQVALVDRKFSLITALLKKVSEICKSNNMTAVSNELLKFQHFVQQQA